MASYTKSLDSKHMLEIGMEGFYGDSMPEKKQYNPGYQVGTDFITSNLIDEIDFATIHAYPDARCAGRRIADRLRSAVDLATAQVVEEVQEEAEAMGGAEGPKDDESPAMTDGTVTAAGDHKRKLDDLEPREGDEEAPLKKQEVSADAPALAADEPGSGDGEVAAAGGLVDCSDASAEALVTVTLADEVKSDIAESGEPKIEEPGAVDVKSDAQEFQPGGELDGSVAADTEKELHKPETQELVNGEGQHDQSTMVPPADLGTMSRKTEVPNNKVGVLIGKAGETIRYLQLNSGAKIQITRDAEANPHSTTRPVELIGTLESINKAEKLIKDVIAEADAGGSPSLVARGFSTIQSGGEQFEIKVPNEKVGLIIGKGGETIKNLQTRSGARIQLIPQHLPEGDASKERTVRITGDKRQIETAKEMIKEVMNQTPRPSALSGYGQQSYRSRGPTSMSHWGARATAPAQPTMGYEYQQRGAYPPPQTAQYPQPYGGYSQQTTPRGSYSGKDWDQRSSAPVHNTPTGGYDYYGQGGPNTGTQASLPNPMSGPSPGPVNYGRPQTPNYGQPTPYGHPAQQHYGQGYSESSRYDSQGPGQQFYGQQQTVGSQPGVQSGFSQQQSYGKPPYGVPHQEVPAYGVPPRASQPGDPTYQGHASSAYGSGTTTQQYPYGSNMPSQPAPSYNQTYGPASGAVDGYTQPPPAAYAQQGGQAAPPGYGQVAQPVPAYAQPSSQSAGYGQYASSQQGYGDSASNGNYGYPSVPADAAYGNTIPGSGYGAPPAGSGQPGYAQQLSNPSGYYDQSVAR
ncbi:KH domain [Musa troglodytarum]|uniref:KH domain n=1 Tax=Musa troglodytarum TaxID=320322 RepID=A0A9E7HKD9_9LILI|nr:KH domain [Musa troglodytarum]